MQILWSHGWGFDARFFNSICQFMPDYSHFFIDWGYFGQPFLPSFPYEQALIGIGHSLGFAKLLELKIPFQRLISLGGFTKFCQSTEFKNGTSKRVLKKMEDKFKINPCQGLADFYVACGYSLPLPLPSSTMNIDLLTKDLQRLTNIEVVLPNVPYLAIAGTDDRVCLLSHQEDLFNNLKTISGEHNFPVTHPIRTYFLIKKFLQDL